MKRAERMCAHCPLRGAPEEERREAAAVEMWPCHEESMAFPHDDPETQCRGHWEAQRKFGKPQA